jgi:hypothetical protein
MLVNRSRRLVAVTICAVAAAVLSATAAARGDDYFLTIGGGATVSNNQMSLERNVLYFQRILAERAVASERHTVLFSDGTDSGRDLHQRDPNGIPRVNELLAQLMGDSQSAAYLYRNHEVPGVNGPARRSGIFDWFAKQTPQLKPGDRVFVYITGHGGKGKPEENGHFYLWNRETMSVQEFSGELDKLPPDVSVVTLMVQCYSGTFANLTFKGGKDADGFSPSNRCGFFATVQTRPAAGCTPDIEEENYQEYSTFFLAALCGHTRTGHRVEPPDYNHDGIVSFDEAHAYAILSADTIDIPVKTSDAFLRKFSRLGKDDDGLLTEKTPFDDLVGRASPADRAVLEGLSAQLKMTEPDRIAEAKRLAESREKERKDFGEKVNQKRRQLTGPRTAIQESIRSRWPELRNPYHPRVPEILRADAGAIVKAIESHSQFKSFNAARAEIEKLTDQQSAAEHAWAKLQRFVRIAENVALAANLSKVADEPTQQRFAALVAAESGTLAGTPAPAAGE